VTKQTQEIIQGKHVKKEEEDKKNLDTQTQNLKNDCAKRMEAAKTKISKLKKEIREKVSENEALEQKARMLKHNVEQREQINNLKSNTNASSEKGPEKMCRDIAN